MPLKGTDKEYLVKQVGWKDFYEEDVTRVERVQDSNLVTVRVVLLLRSIFLHSELYLCLSNLLPDGFSLPKESHLKRKIQSAKESRAKLLKKRFKGEGQGQKELDDFDSQSFSSYFFPKVDPSDSGPSCPECRDLKLQVETLEREKLSLLEQNTKLDSLLKGFSQVHKSQVSCYIT